MPAGALSRQVAALCDELAGRVGAGAAEQVRRVRRRLDEPLRLAVAGRLKVGKSTLVNALIGRRVAPTEAGECTRVVTRFRYGAADRVEVVRRDGRRSSLPLDDAGMVPRRLGVPPRQVAYVDVTLTSAVLRDLTVVDTPGLASTSTAVSAGAQRLLGSAAPFDTDVDDDSVDAVAGAEAVMYVFTQSVREDDVQALAAFRAASARLTSNPINSVAVLTKVDTLVGGAADPWPAAGPLADGQARLLRRSVADVVPVVGLLAETVQAGRLTAADADALRVLSGLPPPQLVLLLASVDRFRAGDAPVPAQRRARLVDLLGLYGVGFAVAQLAARPGLGTGELVRLLGSASGFDRLRQTVDSALRWRTDAIKAGWALSALDRLAGHGLPAGDRELLRDATQQVLRRPEYHRLRLLDAAQQVTTGAVPLPEAMEQELTRLATSADAGWVLGLPQAGPAQLAEAAVAAANRWRVYAVGGASPAQARVAWAAHRGFQLLARSTAGGDR